MQKINFIKMHGLGNDFVIIDKRYKNFEITKNLISKLSDRKSGAGCDQLIIINSNKDSNGSGPDALPPNVLSGDPAGRTLLKSHLGICPT